MIFYSLLLLHGFCILVASVLLNIKLTIQIELIDQTSITIISWVEAVDSKDVIVFCDLLGFDLGQGPDWIEAGIFSQGQRDRLEGFGERAEGVLFDGLDLKLLEV